MPTVLALAFVAALAPADASESVEAPDPVDSRDAPEPSEAVLPDVSDVADDDAPVASVDSVRGWSWLPRVTLRLTHRAAAWWSPDPLDGPSTTPWGTTLEVRFEWGADTDASPAPSRGAWTP